MHCIYTNTFYYLGHLIIKNYTHWFKFWNFIFDNKIRNSWFICIHELEKFDKLSATVMCELTIIWFSVSNISHSITKIRLILFRFGYLINLWLENISVYENDNKRLLSILLVYIKFLYKYNIQNDRYFY